MSPATVTSKHLPGNKVYLVTGSNTGIGLCLVHQFLTQPHTTVIALHRPSSQPATPPANAHPSAALILAAYTTAQTSADIAWLAGTLRTEHGIGRIDAVVAGAGLASSLKPVLDTPWAEVAEHVDVNFGGALRLVQGLRVPLGLQDARGNDMPPVDAAAAAADPDGGGARSSGEEEGAQREGERKFVFLTSSLASSGEPEPVPCFAYGAAKAAANFLVSRLHLECKERGLCAVAVHPGWVKTRMGRDAARAWGAPDDAPPLTAEESAEYLCKLIQGATVASAGGKFLSHDGTELAW